MGIEREHIKEATLDNIRKFTDMSHLEQNNADFVILKGSVAGGEDIVYFHSYVALSHLNTLNMNRSTSINISGIYPQYLNTSDATMIYSDVSYGDRKKFNVIFERESGNLLNIYDKVLELKIPAGVSEIFENNSVDWDAYDKSRTDLILRNMPYAVIGLGKIEETGGDLAVLFFAEGGSPKDVLLEFRRVVRSRKCGFN
jgi:hypothetical protein